MIERLQVKRTKIEPRNFRKPFRSYGLDFLLFGREKYVMNYDEGEPNILGRLIRMKVLHNGSGDLYSCEYIPINALSSDESDSINRHIREFWLRQERWRINNPVTT